MLIHLKATPILETYSCNFIRIDYNRFDEMSSEKKVFLAKKEKNSRSKRMERLTKRFSCSNR